MKKVLIITSVLGLAVAISAFAVKKSKLWR